MTHDNFTPLAVDADADAPTLNAPLEQIDAAIGNLTTLGTNPKTSVVAALGTSTPNTTAQTVVGAINELVASIVALTASTSANDDAGMAANIANLLADEGGRASLLNTTSKTLVGASNELLTLINQLTVNYNSATYWVEDQFLTDQLAGAVNNTTMEPGPGVRTVVDSESKLQLISGMLVFAGGKAAPAYGDPGFWGSAVARSAGVMLCGIKYPDVSGQTIQIGWGSAQSGQIDIHRIMLSVTPNFAKYQNSLLDNSTWGTVPFQFAIVLRATGAFVLTKQVGASATTWRLRYISDIGSTATLYPGISNYSYKTALGSLFVPRQTYLPAPVISDSLTGLRWDQRMARDTRRRTADLDLHGLRR